VHIFPNKLIGERYFVDTHFSGAALSIQGMVKRAARAASRSGGALGSHSSSHWKRFEQLRSSANDIARSPFSPPHKGCVTWNGDEACKKETEKNRPDLEVCTSVFRVVPLYIWQLQSFGDFVNVTQFTSNKWPFLGLLYEWSKESPIFLMSQVEGAV